MLAAAGCRSAAGPSPTTATVAAVATTTTATVAAVATTTTATVAVVATTTTATPAPVATTLPGITTSPSTCRARGVLPDPACTPGAVNPAVTQADVTTTICRSGWTATVRPPVSYTDALKRRQMAAYGFTGSPAGFEEDHLIPLELGGAPSEPRNLWPEPGQSPNPKDKVEDAGRRAVCSGRMPLVTAQQEMAADWTALGRQLGVSP